MSLLDFIFGGNEKIIAKKIAKLHQVYHGDYKRVYDFIMLEVEKELDKKSPMKYLEVQLPKASIKNYAELGSFYLFVAASPDFAKWADITGEFTPKIGRFLRKFGVQEKFVSGNNR